MNALIIFNANPHDGTQKARMTELAEWIKEADKVITF